MEVIMSVGSIVALILMLWCMGREKKLSGFYSEIGVCGRWYAFFTGYFLLAVVACPIMIVVSLLQTGNTGGGLGEVVGLILAIVVTCAAMFLLGYYMYRRVAKKCPEILKKRMFWDMIVIMLGVTTRISLIFMMFILKTWWLFEKPEVYEVDGRTVYAYPGSAELYDEYGMHVGKLSDFGTAAIMD